MPVDIIKDSRRAKIQLADEKLLADLGYKQEFKREFTPIEVYLTRSIRFTAQLTRYQGLRYRIQYHRTFAIDGVGSSARCYRKESHLSCLSSSVLFYSIPNGGPASMVWGVSVVATVSLDLWVVTPLAYQWLVACIFIMLIGLSMAELASAAPTSGGVSPLLLRSTRWY